MFVLQESPIDPIKSRNFSSSLQNGALVSFEGIVRSDKHGSSQVDILQYTADAPICMTEGEKIVKEALALFPISEALCIQRIGKLSAGETAIWIGVWAGHRDEAFKASRYIIEEVKKRLLIWKKEFMADGTAKWIHGSETIAL